jgi:predicted DNA-binding WGR domain protein
MKRELIFVGGGSRKFWTVETKGATMTCWWGRVGTAGQTKSWHYSSPRVAEDQAIHKINEKLNKGYVDTGGGNNGGVPTPAGPPDVTDEEMAAARATLETVMEELSDG